MCKIKSEFFPRDNAVSPVSKRLYDCMTVCHAIGNTLFKLPLFRFNVFNNWGFMQHSINRRNHSALECEIKLAQIRFSSS